MWRKSKDVMALFVALMLVLLGTADMRNMEALTALHPAWEVLALFLVFLVSATLVIFFFLFPDGRFVPRWAGVPILLWSAGLLYLLFPTGLYAALEPPSDWAFPMFVGGLCAGVMAQIYRYVRVSHPVQRQQTKWVVFGATAAVTGTTVVSMLLALFPSLTQPGLPALLTHLASDTAITFCLLLIPVSIGIAVLRYRLWDIDPIVNRTLVYGGLTASIIGI